MNSKLKNEEDIYCNLVTLFVLLCLKVRRLQTQEKSEENLKQAVIINKTTQVIF